MQRLFMQASVLVIGAIVVFPLLSLLSLSISGDSTSGVWSHLASTVLPEYIKTSALLLLGVTVGTLLLGVSSAYIVSQYQFPGKRIWTWALLLPLAMPTYIIAYAYTGLLDIAGPIQSFIRNQFGLSFGEYWFPEVRSLSGAIVVFSLVLYPYVYLLVRSALLSQSPNLASTARLFGYTRWQRFSRVTVPLARPAIVAGVSLALMESLADFGAVSYFGVNTFTTGIYRTWNGLNSAAGAAQLSLALLSFIALLVLLEQYSRRKARYELKNQQPRTDQKRLAGLKLVAALVTLSVPILFGFVVPVAQLVIWAIQHMDPLGWSSYIDLVVNTVSVAAITAAVATTLALVMLYAQRIQNTKFTSKVTSILKTIVGLGYAVPGIVIAVGTLIPLALFDNALDSLLRSWFGVSSGLLLSGTLVALILAYLVRFLTVSINSLEPGFGHIPQSLDMVSRTLGDRPLGVLKRVHFPLLRPSLLSALLIVFVETMKELPATLILRPFNFNTLAVRAYELASDERLPEAAMASVTIVAVGLIPVIFLTRLMARDSLGRNVQPKL